VATRNTCDPADTDFLVDLRRRQTRRSWRERVNLRLAAFDRRHDDLTDKQNHFWFACADRKSMVFCLVIIAILVVCSLTVWQHPVTPPSPLGVTK
jgi:hypothetical protein